MKSKTEENKNKYLTEAEVRKLITQTKGGDNSAKAALYENYKNYIRYLVKRAMNKVTLPSKYNEEKALEELSLELSLAGWEGFATALYRYDIDKGYNFIAFARKHILGPIYKELTFHIDPFSGLTGVPNSVKRKGGSSGIIKVPLDSGIDIADPSKSIDELISASGVPDKGKYNPERRVLQILNVLKTCTDENHSITKDRLGRELRKYRIKKDNNGTSLEAPNTLTSTLESILQELDPLEYSCTNDNQYRIKYAGYKEDRLKKKLNKEMGKRAAEITDFSFVHIFNNKELDELIQLICLTDMLSSEEKKQLVGKLVDTSSQHYKSPFWDAVNIRFNPIAIHGRFSSKWLNERTRLSENLNIIQQALNVMGQIKFKFNQYTAEHTMIPKDDYLHVLSPYHLVVYHDNYYCIGVKKGDSRIWHYRVDLMSNLEMLKDDDGNFIPIDVCPFEGLPIANNTWDPEKYMAEHMHMAYDTPQDIRIKIRNTDYTIIHDWFGNHYKKIKETCAEGYDIVQVRTSPFMIVHWALQYGDAVEVMDENIRVEIRNELKKMEKMYG